MTTTILLICLSLIVPFQDKPDAFKQQIAGFRNKSRFAVKYDKFSDSTSVTAGPFFFGKPKQRLRSAVDVTMSARFKYHGETLNSPVKNFYLIFHASGSEWEFLKNSRFYLIADGERLDLGDGSHDGDVRRGGVSEVLVYALPTETFERVARARSVDLKIGRFEIALKDEHSEALRDLLSLASFKQGPGT